MRKELRPVHDLISCDLCHRTILKGERVETFIGGGDRQQVCELCSLRALRSGWAREAELERRAPNREDLDPSRSLWSRALTWVEEQGLWGMAPPRSSEAENGARTADPPPSYGAIESAPRPASEGAAPAPQSAAPAPQPTSAAPDGAAQRPTSASARADDGPTEADAHRHALEDRRRRAAARAEERRQARRMRAEHERQDPEGDEDDEGAPVARRPSRTPAPAALRDLISGRRREPRHVQAVPTGREAKIELALQLFNDSEHRRTIAGVGRTLGEPWVCAAPPSDDPGAREVGIIVAWELSWYRFRVELDEADEVVTLLDRGNELEDLDESPPAWNAGADAEGRLTLAVEAVS